MCVEVSNQANNAGLAGMIVAAITAVERTSEKAAAKILLVVSVVKNIVISFHSFVWRTISPDAQHNAETVPVLKNGRFLRFSEYSFRKLSFINPKGWGFSPMFGIGDFSGWPHG
ncbi:MAG: hypothetical protein R3235_05320 [Altererythrobacter ishigakiensis]|nr:hypothetical protein [Altererythrobacter ishigakiensis]